MTAENYNYHRIEAMGKHIEAMEKHIKMVETKLRGAEDKLEWFESFADYIAEQHANEYNQACYFADENLELEDRVNYEPSEGDIQEELYTNAYIKPLQKL